MKTPNTLLYINLLVWMYGCSSISVITDYDSQADFSQYQTYRWMSQKDKRLAESLKKKSAYGKENQTGSGTT